MGERRPIKVKARKSDRTVEITVLRSVLPRFTREQAEILCRELRAAIGELSTDLEEDYREAADEQYGEEGSIEIDDDAQVSSAGDGGAYVQAWVYVRDDEANISMDDYDADGFRSEG